MSKVIEGLRYSEDHEWVKVEGNIAVIGISDFAQKELGDITYADLPEVDFQRASLSCVRKGCRGQSRT